MWKCGLYEPYLAAVWMSPGWPVGRWVSAWSWRSCVSGGHLKGASPVGPAMTTDAWVGLARTRRAACLTQPTANKIKHAGCSQTLNQSARAALKKYHRLGGSHTGCVVSGLWRLPVWNEGASRGGCLPKAVRRVCAKPLSLACWQTSRPYVFTPSPLYANFLLFIRTPVLLDKHPP